MRVFAIGLAAFRVASLLASEPGPYRLAERLRERFPHVQPVILTGSGYREMTEVDDANDAVLLELDGLEAEVGRALRCVYCSSIWLAATFAWLDRRAPGIVDGFAAAGIVAAWFDHQHLRQDTITAIADRVFPGGDPPEAAD